MGLLRWQRYSTHDSLKPWYRVASGTPATPYPAETRSLCSPATPQFPSETARSGAECLAIPDLCRSTYGWTERRLVSPLRSGRDRIKRLLLGAARFLPGKHATWIALKRRRLQASADRRRLHGRAGLGGQHTGRACARGGEGDERETLRSPEGARRVG